ncbi:Protein of unknown function DUF374 [hydrothermal vent metagenome]|uniref:DUF374 domain-containing protein n=1 Tax=hydrothermal vent metagenome TaxID=652676 RepID=A0A3B1BKS2_9ZZZZ
MRLVKLRILPVLAFLIMYIVSFTLRLKEVGKEKEKQITREGKPVILSFWHGRLFYIPYYYRKASSGWRILISASDDGEMITRTISWFGYGKVRGSSFKNARRALIGLKRAVDEGYSVAMIADGSRGPCEKMQMGALMVSKLSGAAAIPFAIAFSNCWKMKSWDRFLFPKPFSKVVVIYGDPVIVPPDCASAVLEEKRVELEENLSRITDEADHFFLS